MLEFSFSQRQSPKQLRDDANRLRRDLEELPVTRRTNEMRELLELAVSGLDAAADSSERGSSTDEEDARMINGMWSIEQLGSPIDTPEEISEPLTFALRIPKEEEAA